MKESAVAAILKKYCKSCKTINSLIGTSSNHQSTGPATGFPRKKTKTSILFDNIVEQYEVEVQLPDVTASNVSILVASKKAPYKVQCVSILRALEGNSKKDDKNNLVNCKNKLHVRGLGHENDKENESINVDRDNSGSNSNISSSSKSSRKLEFYAQGWIIDASVPFCMSCNSLFSFFNRRHHCRYVCMFVCLHLFCV